MDLGPLVFPLPAGTELCQGRVMERHCGRSRLLFADSSHAGCAGGHAGRPAAAAVSLASPSGSCVAEPSGETPPMQFPLVPRPKIISGKFQRGQTSSTFHQQSTTVTAQSSMSQAISFHKVWKGAGSWGGGE